MPPFPMPRSYTAGDSEWSRKKRVRQSITHRKMICDRADPMPWLDEGDGPGTRQNFNERKSRPWRFCGKDDFFVSLVCFVVNLNRVEEFESWKRPEPFGTAGTGVVSRTFAQLRNSANISGAFQ